MLEKYVNQMRRLCSVQLLITTTFFLFIIAQGGDFLWTIVWLVFVNISCVLVVSFTVRRLRKVIFSGNDDAYEWELSKLQLSAAAFQFLVSVGGLLLLFYFGKGLE